MFYQEVTDFDSMHTHHQVCFRVQIFAKFAYLGTGPSAFPRLPTP
jgi:hypothetical protein